MKQYTPAELTEFSAKATQVMGVEPREANCDEWDAYVLWEYTTDDHPTLYYVRRGTFTFHRVSDSRGPLKVEAGRFVAVIGNLGPAQAFDQFDDALAYLKLNSNL